VSAWGDKAAAKQSDGGELNGGRAKLQAEH
jgi:hypothetical protein